MEVSDSSKKALIFGGSGFIGAHLTRELLLLGYEVHIADIEAPEFLSTNFHYCDIRQRINLDIKITPDIVFNLAAIHRTPGHTPQEYYTTNVGGSLKILEWCNAKNVRKIVFASSIAVYGTSGQIKDEFSELSPSSDYGRSKAQAEDLFRLWFEEQREKRTLIICRPAVIFGKGENGNFTRLARALRFRYFFYPGSRDTIKSCGYVKDLVASFIFMLQKSNNSNITYNFCFPDYYSIGDICSSFNRVAGYAQPISIPVFAIGKLLLYIPGRLSTVGARLLKLVFSSIIRPAILNQAGFVWKYDLESALADWKSTKNGKNFFE